jgi:hypothetical protein
MAVAFWCCSFEGKPERFSVMKYCTDVLAQIRSLRHHSLAEEIREVIKKGRGRYVKDLIKELEKCQ